MIDPLDAVTVRVQHSPRRAPLLPALVGALAPLAVQVVTDPGGDRPLAWRCYRQCLVDPPASEWLLVIQDDAQPCEGFHAALSALLPRLEHPTCLFLPTTALITRQAFWQAQIAGCDLCEHNPREWVPVVALLWPTALIPGFLDWTDRNNYRDAILADDEIVGRWARHTHTTVCVTVPSLVEHPDLVPSLVNPSDRRERHALAF